MSNKFAIKLHTKFSTADKQQIFVVVERVRVAGEIGWFGVFLSIEKLHTHTFTFNAHAQASEMHFFPLLPRTGLKIACNRTRMHGACVKEMQKWSRVV
jgi:hypothetical protein